MDFALATSENLLIEHTLTKCQVIYSDNDPAVSLVGLCISV